MTRGTFIKSTLFSLLYLSCKKKEMSNTNLNRKVILSKTGLPAIPSNPIGLEYSNDFTSGHWTTVGTHTTWTFGSSIRANGALFSGGKLDYIILNTVYTSSEAWTFSITYTVNTTTTGNYGPYPALLSVSQTPTNPAANRVNSVFAYCDGETSFAGLTTLFVGSGAGTWSATDTGTNKFTPTTNVVGDVINVKLIRLNMYDYNVISTNVTTGSTQTLTRTISNAYPTTLEMTNTCRLAIGNVGGDNTITAWSFTNNDNKGLRALIIADSKMSGLESGAVSNRAANLLYTTYGKICAVSGGPSDHISDQILNTSEFALYTPVKAIIQTCCNDKRSGRTDAQISADIQTMKTAMEATGAIVYVMTPTPENVLDLSSLAAKIRTDYPTCYIDAYVALLGTGTQPDPTLVVADGVHPSVAGHVVIANLLNSYI